MENWSVDTMLQHLAEEEHLHGAVVAPIFQNSLFVKDSCEVFLPQEGEDFGGAGHVYSRISNPTLDIAESKIAALEGGDRCKLFSSGMGAISAGIMSATHAGAHVVCTETAYGPTQKFLRDYMPRFGVSTTFVDGSDTAAVMAACLPNTTLMVLESPGWFLFNFQDLRALTTFARERSITTMIDNSYSAGVFQQPLSLGVDIVVHSVTKYLNGHSDVVAGALVTSHERMEKILVNEYELFGGALAPFAAWLVTRGLRTLMVRMRAHEAAGNAVATYLKAHPRISQVFHAADPDHPHRALFESQMTGSSGLLSFAVRDADRASMVTVVDNLRIFQRGVSWGGFESLAMPLPFICESWTEPRWIVRLSLGLEGVDDLIADLDRALSLPVGTLPSAR